MPRSINIEEGTASKRAARPSLELYRPGMLKRVGTLPEHNRDMNTTVTERKAERGISVECVASSSNDKRSNTSQVHEVQHSSKFRRYDFHTNENKWMESDRNYRGGSSHRARQDAQRGRSRHYSIMNEPERYPQTSRRRSSIPNDYGHQNNPHESIQRDGHVSLHNSSQASIGECRMSRNENDSKNNTNDRSVQTGRGGLASRQLPETSITLEKCDPLNELCNLMGNSLDFNAAYEEHEQLMTKETETRMMESAVKISVCSDTSNIRRDCGHSGKHNYSRPRSRASRDNRPNHWHFRNQGNNRFHRDDRSSQSEHSEISILVKPNPSRMQVVDDTNGISSSMRINDADARTAANLNYFMDALISATDRKISVEEAVEIREISAKISKLYSSMLTQNIEYAYNANVEHRLWRECFYIPIEALRKHCNCSSTENQASHFVKEQLSLLIKEGLSFYSNVLKDYEGCYGIVIDNFLYWPCGRPTDDFCSCVSVGRGAKLVEGYIVEKTLLSVQRLLLSIGDLSRYNSMFSSSREYSSAKQWYLKALQLCFSNGRAYNQVALISLLDSKWVDAIFFFVRALGAKQPFGVAKQTLITAFNDLYKKIKVYDAQLDVKLGISSSIQQMSENALQLTDYPHEIWISASGRKTESDASEWTVDPAHFFRVESIRELYRRTVLYLLHAAGLLITKIGMENFDKISDRALSQLSALIDREECVLSSTHVLQISTLLLFAVHNSTPQHEDPDSCSLQQQKSIQMVLSLYGVLLQPIADCLDDLELALVDSTTLSPKIRNVLPAVFILSEWFSMPSVNRIYRHMPSLEPLDTSLVCVKTWKVLAQIANHLFRMEADRKLIRAISLTEREFFYPLNQILPTNSLVLSAAAVHPEAVEILLPESIFLASFCDIFPTVPKSITLSRTPKTDSLPSLLAIHARFSSILSAAEYLDGSDLHCFQFDEKQNRFTSTTSSTSPAHGETVKSYEENDSLLTLTRSPSVSSDDQLDADFDEHLNFRIALKQNKAKQELLEREVVNRVFLEVRPKYLVPDTNTFIDHLQSIISIVISGSFEICVNTTVISELSCLSLPPTNKSSIFSLADDQTHENWVGEQARKAMNFLNEACQKRTPHICTVTTKGSRLATLSLLAEQCSLAAREQKALNDDLILESCIQLCSKVAIFPTGATSTTDSSRRIQRSVVLLTEDRALKIKAVCANIPCKTVPSFLKWASK